MIKRQQYRKLSNHHATIDDDGKPRRTVITILQDNDDRQLIIENCSNIIVRGASVKGWSAAGDVMKGKPYAIDVREGCTGVTIETPSILGQPDEFSKRSWRQTAANGLIVREGNVDINIINPHITRAHYGADLRGDIGSMIGGTIKLVSADNVCGRGNGWSIDGVTLRESLEVVSYDELHRDLIQLYKVSQAERPEFLENWTVKNCILGSQDKAHTFQKPGQVFLFSDGIGKKIHVIDNNITTEHDLAIVMSVCIGAEIRRNKIWTIGQCKPQIRVIEQRYGVKSEAITIEDNPIQDVAYCSTIIASAARENNYV